MPPRKLGESDGGRAHHLGIVGHVVEDGAFRRDLDAIANLEMAGKAALAGDRDIIAELGGTGDAHLRNKQAMFPDLHVVPDLDQVIDLGPLADHGLAERCPINRSSGSNLDVVLDPDDADLRDLVMLALVSGEAVTIRADDDARNG